MTIEFKQHSKTEDENPELLMFMKLPNNRHRLSQHPFVFDHSIEMRKVHKVGTDQVNRGCVRAIRVATSSVITDQTSRRSSSTGVVNLGLA